VPRTAQSQISFADWELLQQGLTLEPLLQDGKRGGSFLLERMKIQSIETNDSFFGADPEIAVRDLRMAVTDPSVNPFSLAQCSRIYCERKRLGSSVWATPAQRTATSPTVRLRKSQYHFRSASGEILEFLKHNLIFFLQGALFAGDDVEQYLKSFFARGRYSRSENVFRNNWACDSHRRSSNGFEAGAARLPMQ
jgi:hypothetical protein